MTDEASPVSQMRERIDAVLTSDAKDLVAAYFDEDGPFAADTFDTLGDNDPYRVGPADIAAVSLLDVSLPPRAVRALTAPSSEAALMLQAIDHGTPLWGADDDLLANATKLWTWLTRFENVGPVVAGKLLARKRPHLVPIYDRVIEDRLQPPAGGFWTTLRAALEDSDLRGRIDALRPADLDSRVTTLRLLDVAVWMTGSEGRNAQNARSAG